MHTNFGLKVTKKRPLGNRYVDGMIFLKLVVGCKNMARVD
jgi:hypothetical protein